MCSKYIKQSIALHAHTTFASAHAHARTRTHGACCEGRTRTLAAAAVGERALGVLSKRENVRSCSVNSSELKATASNPVCGGNEELSISISMVWVDSLLWALRCCCGCTREASSNATECGSAREELRPSACVKSSRRQGEPSSGCLPSGQPACRS